MQVSYLKMSPYLFHPISTYFPLIKSKFLATPNTFYLQHLPPQKSPVAGSKANFSTYLPLEDLVPALPRVVQTLWQNKASEGLRGNYPQTPCVLGPD